MNFKPRNFFNGPSWTLSLLGFGAVAFFSAQASSESPSSDSPAKDWPNPINVPLKEASQSDLDATDARGYTLLQKTLRSILHSSPEGIRDDDLQLAGELIFAGADLYTIADRWGNTAQDYLSAIRRKGDVAKLHFNEDAQLDALDEDGYTLLQKSLRHMIFEKDPTHLSQVRDQAGALILAGADLTETIDPNGHSAQAYLNKIRKDNGGTSAHAERKGWRRDYFPEYFIVNF